MSLDPAVSARLKRNADGLIAAVVVEHATSDVLMMAWMNDEALRLTRETGFVHFFSRSRNRLWKKGETSGNTLQLVEIRDDCDADTFLVRAIAAGPACHTGTITCWGDEVPVGELEVLQRTIAERLAAPEGTRSYVKELLATPTRVAEKIVEEAGELSVEIAKTDSPKERIVAEAADLLFHVLVGLGARGVTLEDVERELSRRAGTSGLDEKAARKK